MIGKEQVKKNPEKKFLLMRNSMSVWLVLSTLLDVSQRMEASGFLF